MTNYPDGQEINQLSVDILYYSGLSPYLHSTHLR